MDKLRLKFSRYIINLAGDCFIEIEELNKILKENGYEEIKKKEE